MSNCECDIIVRQREINGRIKTYYKLTAMLYDFNSALDWCHGLGGQLPIILTREELDFLADDVVVKDDLAGTGIFVTWMGLKKDRGFCSNWLDGTEVNMTFSYNPKCESCTASCCGMVMWNNDENYAKMGFKDCRKGAIVVCVFDEEKTVVLPKDPAYLTKLYGQLNDSILVLSEKTENKIQSIIEEYHETEKQLKKLQTWIDDNVNTKEMDSLKKSSSTSNILHWTTLTMIGCLAVILAVIGYRARLIICRSR